MASATHTGSIGELGETLGCQYLINKGYRIVERNYQNTKGRRLGEIDIVAENKRELVFVEVKTRLQIKDRSALLPEANITREKLHRLERIVQCYLRERKRTEAVYHFDALSILYDATEKKAKIRHLEHIFL